MKVKLSSLGETGEREYDSQYDWNCFCQAGAKGVVFSKKGNYRTAFFEAFPKDPECFIRGEGKTLEEAEKVAWEKYQKIKSCDHEMERRNRTDGYAYCKHCSYSATVFEPLTKCCKCGVPTSYSEDYRGKWYCEKHDRCKPKNPTPSYWELRCRRGKLPRRKKKLYKKCATAIFRRNRHKGKVKAKMSYSIRFVCDGYELDVLFRKREFIERGLELIRAYGKSAR